MSVLIRYKPTNLTQERYEKINEFFMQQMQSNPELLGPPEALQVHVLFGEGDDLQVSEIWQSEDLWRAQYDGGLLGQALDYAGVERDPEVLPVAEFWGTAVPAPPAPPA